MEKMTSLTSLPEEASREELKPLSHPGLGELRQRIKEVMIPLLIHIFHLRQTNSEEPTAQTLIETPSQKESEIVQKLYVLKNDLTHLSLWCSSCLSQIEKALTPPKMQQLTQCCTSKKTSNLKFSQLFSHHKHAPSTLSLLEKFKGREKQSLEKESAHPSRPSLRQVFSLAFRRNPRT